MDDTFTPCGRAPPPPPNGLTAVLGVARPQGGWPAAVFFPLGYPTPYGPGKLWVKSMIRGTILKNVKNVKNVKMLENNITN